MVLICISINPVGGCSEMTVLGFRSSLLVIIIIIIIVTFAWTMCLSSSSTAGSSVFQLIERVFLEIFPSA